MKISTIKIRGRTPKRIEAHQYRNLLVPLSHYVTKVFIDNKLPPTLASLLSIFISAIGSLFFLTGQLWWIFVGFIIHHIGYMFDIVDGQVARIQKNSSLLGDHIDAINHFFNIPIIFLCLGIGLYNATGMILFIYVGIVTSLFCRGDSKYCIGKALIQARRRVEIGEYDPMTFTKFKGKITTVEKGLSKKIKTFVIFPNILGFLTVATILTFFVGQILVLAFFSYAALYVILDIGEMYLDFRNKKSERLYWEYFEK